MLPELERIPAEHLVMPRKDLARLFVEREEENAARLRSQVMFRKMESQAAHRLPHIDFHTRMDAQRRDRIRTIKEHIDSQRSPISHAINLGQHLAHRLPDMLEGRTIDIRTQLLEAEILRPQEIARIGTGAHRLKQRKPPIGHLPCPIGIKLHRKILQLIIQRLDAHRALPTNDRLRPLPLFRILRPFGHRKGQQPPSGRREGSFQQEPPLLPVEPMAYLLERRGKERK